MAAKSIQPDLSPNAPWKQRYRAPRLMGPRAAFHAPDRGAFISNRTGMLQTYTWDLAAGTTRQVSRREEGLFNISLDPFGKFVYFLSDTKGNEIGHYARFPSRILKKSKHPSWSSRGATTPAHPPDRLRFTSRR